MGERTMTSLDRVSTGNTELDAILDGGIPAGSVTMIIGDPGSGKTVLALQQLFQAASEGRRCLYVTTLSEPALKIIKYMQLFRFFDGSLLEERILLRDLGDALLTEGADAARAQLQEMIEIEEPELVVIDSFKVFHDLLEPAEARRFIYELAVSLSAWGATALLLGEYTPNEPLNLPEFAIADGIIRLGSERYGLTSLRELQVLKMRGVGYAAGIHLFEITTDGVRAYPRLRVPTEAEVASGHAEGRAPFELAALDELLAGGLPRGSTTLIQGGSGTGKTLLGLQFLTAGAEVDEPAIHFGLEEMPAQLRGVAASFGWNVEELESRGLFRFEYTSPVELVPDRFLYRVLQQTEASGAKRVVLDSLGSVRSALASQERFRDLVYAFSQHMRARGVTVLMLTEAPGLLATPQLATQMLSSLADNVILLRYVEEHSALVRAISVLKARGVAHSSELRRFAIGARGPEIGAPFAELRGVLTGAPMPLAEPSGGLPGGGDS